MTYTYQQDGKCQAQVQTSLDEAQKQFNDHKMKKGVEPQVLVSQGKVLHTYLGSQSLADQDGKVNKMDEHSVPVLKLSQCLGFAVLDGNLKRKTFGAGNFFVVN